eukprot:5706533-Pleurochrysis_carterae.AAC.1
MRALWWHHGPSTVSGGASVSQLTSRPPVPFASMRYGHAAPICRPLSSTTRPLSSASRPF